MRVRNQVTGNLLPDELVVRHIGVECVDDPVAVPPGVGLCGVVKKPTEAIAVASDVEPVTPPPFTVLRRFEKFIDRGGNG